eukprot:1146653-Rhodomonas_salina.1
MGVQPAARAFCSRSVHDALCCHFSICAMPSSGSGLRRASCALESCEGIQRQGPFAADLCPMSFSAISAFVPCQAADLVSDTCHVLWKAVRACRCQGSSV